MNWWIIAGLGLAGFGVYKFFFNKGGDDSPSKGRDDAVAHQKTTKPAFFMSADRLPGDIKDVSAASLGGQPMFYNEVDHLRGRFVGWVRTKEDLADERKINANAYRARLTIDVKYFWVFPGHKNHLTPCVFRPGIDAIFKGPGEETGVPNEGIVIFKRSTDGTRIHTGEGDRFRMSLMDEKHKNSVMTDMLANVLDKERLQGRGDTSKEFTEDMENKLKRTKRLADAVGKEQSNPFGNPYGSEMYGEEAPVNPAGSDNPWKFEG